MYQTRPPTETRVYVSGYEPGVLSRLSEDFPHVVIVECEFQKDWGHSKRARGVDEASCEYLGFFNDDDSYDVTYLEKMLAVADRGDLVAYCDWGFECEFAGNSSTSGNFIVNTGTARRAGYVHRKYDADAEFINAVRAITGGGVKVPEVLYEWNAIKR